MLEAAQKAVSLTSGRKRGELDRDEVLVLALAHLLEIVGEAAKNVSRATQERFSEIPWRQIGATRNRIIHGYDTVDIDILWDIISSSLPPVISALKKAVTLMEP